MANKKTRALRRAEYLRQREVMDMQAREAVAMQTVQSHEQEEKHSGTSGGEVCRWICIRRCAAGRRASLRRSRLARDGHSDGQGMANWPQAEEAGATRDIVARKAGFSSTTQMRRAQEVAEKRPDLMDRVDKGEQTISGAYRDMQQAEKPKAADSHSSNAPLSGFIEEEPVDIPDYEVYKPAQQETPGNVRTVKGADHEHLLENPIYRRLYESYNEAVQQINLVRGDMRTRCEGYERRIRGYRENIQTLQREVERLKEALHAGA